MERKHFIEILISGRIFNNKYIDINEEDGDIFINYYFEDVDNELLLMGYGEKRLDKINLKIKKSELGESFLLISSIDSMPLVISGSRKIDYINLFNIMKKMNKYEDIICLTSFINNGLLLENDLNILNKEKNSGLFEIFKNHNDNKTYILFSELIVDMLNKFYKGEMNAK